MSLKVQIITLIFSFLYGIFFFLQIKFNSKYLYSNKKIYKITISGLIVLTNVLLYFYILRYLNNGIFHIYYLFMIVLSYVLSLLYFNKKIEK